MGTMQTTNPLRKIDGPDHCPTDRGFYIVCGDFEIEEKYLKIGIATWGKKEDGWKRRISDHYNSNFQSSVLARHLFNDYTLSKKFNIDLTKQSERKKFLGEHCYFKILPSPSMSDEELASCEKKIENELRGKIRYIDKVVPR